MTALNKIALETAVISAIVYMRVGVSMETTFSISITKVVLLEYYTKNHILNSSIATDRV